MANADKTNSLLKALLAARLHDPYAYLGAQAVHNTSLIRVFYPQAANIWVKINNQFDAMTCIHADGVFEWRGKTLTSTPYLLRIEENTAAHENKVHETYDPYFFSPQISEHDLYLFNEGSLQQAYRCLGAHSIQLAGIEGVRFSVWAPSAERVSVVGDFNRWDGRVHPMAVHHSSGVWELFIPGLPSDAVYKYEIRNRDSGEILLKTDPYATRYELRPNNAALTPTHS
ncbi:MAG: 1,4-alpha-glucan branching enzyme, partial [Betaproteobacteria bacterium]|nr:1,4-alpha-glucan branching enzyme [Betaproteobacteria bacterium]